jgi:hypothetical protein
MDDPLVDRLATDAQARAHCLHGFPLVEPQQSLGPTQLMGVFGASDNGFQRDSFLWAG